MCVVLVRTKRQTLPQVRESSSCMTAFEPGLVFFPDFGLKQRHQLLLSFQPVDLWTGSLLVLGCLDADWD